MSRYVAENSECETNPVRRDRIIGVHVRRFLRQSGFYQSFAACFHILDHQSITKDEPRTDDG